MNYAFLYPLQIYKFLQWIWQLCCQNSSPVYVKHQFCESPVKRIFAQAQNICFYPRETHNSTIFFKNINFYNELCMFFFDEHAFFKNRWFYLHETHIFMFIFQKPKFLQWIIHRAAGSHFGTFLAPGGVNGGAEPSRAGPSRAEPSRARALPKPKHSPQRGLCVFVLLS